MEKENSKVRSIDMIMDEETFDLYSAERRDAAIKAELSERSYDDGRDDGRHEGIEIGKKEEKIDIAKSMLKDNVDLEVISKYTNLTVDEIKKL